MNGIVLAAREIAEDLLFPAATETDRADAVPRGHFEALAAAGLYGLAGPADAGGSDVDLPTLGAVAETLAGACLATTFVWGQHNGLVRRLAASRPSALAEVWLTPLCRGERRSGVALGGLIPGPSPLHARPGPDGWVLDGTSPWVTGWGLIDVLLVAARGPDRTIAWFLAEASAQAGLTVSRQRLAAVDASVTVQLDCAGLELPDDRLILLEAYDDQMYSMAHILRFNGFLALGVAGRCCTLIGPSPLDDEVAAGRERLLSAPDDDLPDVRAALSELAVRAATALMVKAGSRSILADEHPQRLAREALFLLVFGSRPLIKAGLLTRLGAARAADAGQVRVGA